MSFFAFCRISLFVKVNMKNILFVLDYYRPHYWWMENVFEHIISGLLEKWYNITVLTTRYNDDLEKYEEKKHSDWYWKWKKTIKIYRIWKNRKFFLLWWVIRWIKLLKQSKFDLIYTSTYWWAFVAWILGKLFRKKTILTIHELFWKLRYFYKWKIKGFFYLLFEKIIFLFKYDVYHCVSLYTLNSVRLLYSVSDEKLKLVYNWIDYGFWNKKNIDLWFLNSFKENIWLKNTFVLLYYWHTWKSKWLDYFVDSIQKIFKKYPDTTIIFNLLASKRKYYFQEKILNIQKIIGWKSQIILLDWLDQKTLLHLVWLSNIVIAPSISEWFWSVHTEVVNLWKNLITTYIWPLVEVLSWKVKFISPKSSEKIVEAIDEIRLWNIEEKCNDNVFLWSKTVNSVDRLIKLLLKKNI